MNSGLKCKFAYFSPNQLFTSVKNTFFEIDMILDILGAPYVNISEAIRAFEKGNMRGKFESQPLEAVQILNIILSYGANLDPKFVNLGRRFFQPDQRGRVENIGGGKFLWLGSFESVRVGWKIRLNIDMANKPAYEKGIFISARYCILSKKN